MRGIAILMALCLLSACDVEQDPRPEADVPEISPAPSPRGVAPEVGAKRIQPVGGGASGMVCGDPRLIGSALPPISGAHPGCVVENPVSLESVAGVHLTGKVELNCEAAIALANWTDNRAKPAARELMSSPLVSMQTAGSYACRPRNNRRGAKLSEHAKGAAIDLTGFTLANGRTVTVTRGWRAGGAEQAFTRRLWSEACGPFGTVLGPAANRYHQDHFHFDTKRYRIGTWCR